jgi:DNA gyrase subunit A
MSIRFHEDDLRTQGRNTIGVRGIKLKGDDYVVALAIVNPDATLLVASENGLGKRTSFDEYRLQSRAGSGIKTMNCTEKTGKVVSATVVTETDELMLMTTAGQSVRIKVSTIREAGRNTQGVKLMTLNEKESIQDISVVIADDNDSEDEASSDDAPESPDSEAPTEETPTPEAPSDGEA